MKKIFDKVFGAPAAVRESVTSESNSREGRDTRKSASSYSQTSFESMGKRALRDDWPVCDLLRLDPTDYDDDALSSTSLDQFIWKTALTDNETPPIFSKLDLRRHSTPVDAWVALNGLVYDVTTFAQVHPGGFDRIAKGMGQDVSDLFKRVKKHKNVSIKDQIGKFCMGIYIQDFHKTSTYRSVESRPILTADENQGRCKLSPSNLFSCIRGTIDPETDFKLQFVQNDDLVILMLEAPRELDREIGPDGWTFVLWDWEMLYIKVMLSPSKCWIGHYKLFQPIQTEYIFVSFRSHHNHAVLAFPKGDLPDTRNWWKSFGTPLQKKFNCCVQPPDNSRFDDSTRALLFYRQQMGKKIVLYGFKLRPSSYLGVPIGYTLMLTVNDSAARLYPTSFTVLDCREPVCEIKGQTFFFLISEDFRVTDELNDLQSMDENEMMQALFVCIGEPLGTFDTDMLKEFDTLLLITSGLGVAVWPRILHYFRDMHPQHMKNRHIIMLNFNRSPAEIVWHTELIDANHTYPWFNLFLIVEEPDLLWQQLVGNMSRHLIKWCMKAIPGVWGDNSRVVKALVSGENEFLNSSQRILDKMHDIFTSVYYFSPPKEVPPYTRASFQL